MDIQKIENYIEVNARKLDLMLYHYFFKGGTTSAVIQELKNYQNEDGGFGHGLEPDVQAKESSVLATSIAFQYLTAAKVSRDEIMVKKGLKYLADNYNKEKQAWFNLTKPCMDSPRAPWWNYEKQFDSEQWGNPTAEILGYFIMYQPESNLLEDLKDKAIHRLNEIKKPEFHEIMCFTRLYEMSGTEFQKKVFSQLSELINRTIDKNVSNWGNYSATPFSYINSHQSPLFSIFDSSLINADLERVKNSIVNGDHWEPRWDWGDLNPNVWLKAKRDWIGKLTVESVAILKNFDFS
ncbi:hypothetical protein [Candidatus Uabimicrobium amorphum]|uniref:Uncharacterized protein n=1 Tax=Uabimicrobium amorphum TaxID=2596890 RepID=A0A5S9F6X7_UABAM|nr:hypothetical protein [Candidatus Uabimicrobium amorphum]BBM87159.1 hypothetical protein UABAM_05562 [Candidatus Uabimicrobium amorphum]